MFNRDLRIRAYRRAGKTQVDAVYQADVDLAAHDAKVAQKKAERDYALSLKWKPGTPHPGRPIWNATKKRWERKQP